MNNVNYIDFSNLVPLESFRVPDPADESSFALLLSEATEKVAQLKENVKVSKVYVGFFYADIIAVFLVEFQCSPESIGMYTWIVVGDIPPALIACEKNPNAASALYSYLKDMGAWADAAMRRESVADLVNVNVPATPENATRLQTRISMLEEHILCNFRDEIISDD